MSQAVPGTFEILATDPRRRRGGAGCGPRTDRWTPPSSCRSAPRARSRPVPRELEGLGVQCILGNTYHLNIRPGIEVMAACGGLHRFMGWNRPILTDSGGYQVFSLAKLRKIRPDGVEFASHIDGSPIFLGPREAMAIQRAAGVGYCDGFRRMRARIPAPANTLVKPWTRP
jgi:queuine tRNA-ribosyltransferase